jgi:hypothetical protein
MYERLGGDAATEAITDYTPVHRIGHPADTGVLGFVLDGDRTPFTITRVLPDFVLQLAP